MYISEFTISLVTSFAVSINFLRFMASCKEGFHGVKIGDSIFGRTRVEFALEKDGTNYTDSKCAGSVG